MIAIYLVNSSSTSVSNPNMEKTNEQLMDEQEKLEEEKQETRMRA